MHFCLYPRAVPPRLQSLIMGLSLGLDLLDICQVQPTPLIRFVCEDPLDCSRHILDIFSTSSCSHPVSRNCQGAGLRVSQANLPMTTGQKTMDHRLNRESFSHIAVSKQPDSYRYLKIMQSVFKYTSVLLQCLLLPCDS